jgi:hypothetical protein
MRNLIMITCFCLTVILFTGCEDNLNVRQDALTNYAVDINGNWKLFSISRNGEDLSSKISFADYTLELSDGSFSVNSSTVPFPTLKSAITPFASGSWSFNDDYYPTHIQFTNGSEVISVKLGYPAYGTNNSSLTLEFSLGCNSNTYLYQFKK